MRRKTIRRSWTALAALGALSACASTASAQFNLNKLKQIGNTVNQKTKNVQEAMKPMTVQEEVDVGREVASKFVAYFHLYNNDAVTRYINLVGDTVAAQSDRQDITYHFAVLDSPDINAFSAPGGYVFVTRGAVMLCEDESELAAVLAHEVGHIAGKHVIKIVERDKTLRGGMQDVSANTNMNNSAYAAYLQKMSSAILVKTIDQGLAPGDEFDADARGIRYAHAAGYPADGLERFLARLGQATDQGAHSFFSRTHPPVKDRNDRIQQLIASNHWEDADRPKLAERFQALTQSLKTKGGM
jgi:predicted Zn-dependent protease